MGEDVEELFADVLEMLLGIIPPGWEINMAPATRDVMDRFIQYRIDTGAYTP